MNFIEELKWRGMMHNATPDVEEHLASGKRVGYIGFDPTAPSMTIGNFVQIMILKLFQLSGHTPIMLMGGATGRIGDPSGKDQERTLKSYEELDSNLERQFDQVKKLLDFDSGSENQAIMVNNLDFYKNQNVLEFLRDVGKTLTVNYMMSKDSVKTRLETGLSFTEFSYQLLQGYDFQKLYETHGCTVQMGGSDQWGNITTGTEFIRKNLGKSAFAVTTPLLTKADGSKFGKSEEGNIWLSREMTSPYRFYQFWINMDDADISSFTRYFTLRSKEEVEANEVKYADDPRELKRILAEELTIRIHSQKDYEAARTVSELLFNKHATREALLTLDEFSLKTVAEEIPSFEVDKSLVDAGVNLVDLIAEHTQIVNSKGDARRAIKGNALSVNKEKVSTHELIISADHLLQNKFVMIENGKKNKFMLKFE